jgi:hypothetical protein
MDVTVHIPDDIAARLCAAGGDLSRLALEGLALEEDKSGHITKAELRRLLGFGLHHRRPRAGTRRPAPAGLVLRNRVPFL